MRLIGILVAIVAILSWISPASGQRFLEQLERVLDAEAAAVESKEKASRETLEPKTPKDAAAAPPGYLGLIADANSGQVRVELVREDTPAERAGVRVGDVILQVDGSKVATLDQMGAALAPYAAGERIILTVERDDESIRLPVTLGVRSEGAARAERADERPDPAGAPRVDSLDALRELERLLDEAPPRKAAAPKTAAPDGTAEARRRERIAEIERELEAVRRRMVELERKISRLAE